MTEIRAAFPLADHTRLDEQGEKRYNDYVYHAMLQLFSIKLDTERKVV